MSRFRLAFQCDQPWEGMRPVAKGRRHCASCRKTVVDVSRMTGTEVAKAFKKNGDELCVQGWFERRDGELLLAPLPEKRRLSVLQPASLVAAMALAACNEPSDARRSDASDASMDGSADAEADLSSELSRFEHAMNARRGMSLRPGSVAIEQARSEAREQPVSLPSAQGQVTQGAAEITVSDANDLVALSVGNGRRGWLRDSRWEFAGGGLSYAPELSERAPAKRDASTSSDTPLTADQLRRIITQGRPGLDQCYERLSRNTGTVADVRMDVSITVSASGRVSSATALGDGGEYLNHCIVSLVERWRFPEAEGETQTQFPLIFTRVPEPATESAYSPPPAKSPAGTARGRR